MIFMQPFDHAWKILKEDVKCPHCGNPSQIDPATGSPEECISCYNQKWSPMMNPATAFRGE